MQSDNLTIDCIREVAYGQASGLKCWDTQKAACMLLDALRENERLMNFIRAFADCEIGRGRAFCMAREIVKKATEENDGE